MTYQKPVITYRRERLVNSETVYVTVVGETGRKIETTLVVWPGKTPVAEIEDKLRDLVRKVSREYEKGGQRWDD